MRKYIGHVQKSTTKEQGPQPVVEVWGRISNGGVGLTITADEEGHPKIEVVLDHFGNRSTTTFSLAAEGLRDFGMAFLGAAQHPFSGWSFFHGRTPCSPGLNPEFHLEDRTGMFRIEVSEEELLLRHKLLQAELARVEMQLANVVDAPPYNDVVDAMGRFFGAESTGILEFGDGEDANDENT